MFEYTEYELQKRRNKQELVRNEFKTVGKYQIPLIRKQDIDLDTISLISFSDIKQDDKENAYKTVHFFTYDWLFDKVYEKEGSKRSARSCGEYAALYFIDLRYSFNRFALFCCGDLRHFVGVICGVWRSDLRYFTEVICGKVREQQISGCHSAAARG